MESLVPTLTRIAKKGYVSPLRYPGGKRKLITHIALLLTEQKKTTIDRIYEPFAGGAAVSIAFLESGFAKEAVISDKDELVSAFWAVVFSDESEALIEKIKLAKVDLASWKKIKSSEPETPLERAFKCLFLNRTSFSGSLHDSAGPIGGHAQTSDYPIDCRLNKDALIQRIRQLAIMKNRVRVRDWDFRKLLNIYTAVRKSHSAEPNTFWYFDPPFFNKAEKLYRHAFDFFDHLALRDYLKALNEDFVLSYDFCSEASTLYRAHPGYSVVDMRYTAATQKKAIQDMSNTEIIVSRVSLASQKNHETNKRLIGGL